MPVNTFIRPENVNLLKTTYISFVFIKLQIYNSESINKLFYRFITMYLSLKCYNHKNRVLRRLNVNTR